MFSFRKYFESIEDEDYRGTHRAPSKTEDSTAPLWDLTRIYPDDIYSSNSARYYGDGSPLDDVAVNIMKSFRNKPNSKLTVYRAVPNIYSESDIELKSLKQKISDANKTFPKIDWSEFKELGFNDYEEIPKYKEYLINRLDELGKTNKSKKFNINSGDWVTTVKKYAKDHGEASLRGDYKILSKVVYARDLFTDANSVFEFGYDPQPPVK